MGWINRVNRYFLDAIANRRLHSAPASAALLRLSPELIGKLTSLDLASHDEFVGESLVLWGALADGTHTAITDTDEGWAAIRAALDQSGLLVEKLHVAELRLLADPKRKPLRLIGDNQRTSRQ